MTVDLFFVDLKTRDLVPNEFGKSSQELEQNVQILTEWLKTQPHLPEVMDPAMIRNFLLLNKLGIEKTKKKIDMYYTIRSIVPDMFANTNPNSEQMIDSMKNGFVCVHPTLKNNHRCYFAKLKSPKNFDFVEVMMQQFNILEVRLHEDCVVGDILIYDAKHASFDSLKAITPTILKDAILIYKVYSMRLKALYIVNSPPWISWVIKMLKTVLKPKLFDRVHVHDNEDILKEIFTKEELPQDYGGDGFKLETLNEMIIQKFCDYKDRFDKLEKMKVDESLRPIPLSNDDMLGYYGNFKQLSVD